MQPLPVLSPETAAAVETSAQRAKALVIEAATERTRSHAAYAVVLKELHDRLKELHARGFYDIHCSSFGQARDVKWDRLQAVNTLRRYAAPRYAKILRARLRRYERLRYLYELEHPQFSHPEFPQHPGVLMWHASLPLPAGFSGWALNNANGERPGHLLSEEDNEISPVLTTRPLPAA